MDSSTTVDDILEVIQLAERSGTVKAIWFVADLSPFVRLRESGDIEEVDDGWIFRRTYRVSVAVWRRLEQTSIDDLVNIGVDGQYGQLDQFRVYATEKRQSDIPDLVQIPGVWLLMSGTHNYLVEEHKGG